jgi:hypothetical protein
MLSFDIETTGISPKNSNMTVACTYDGTRGVTYHFAKPVPPEEGTCECARIVQIPLPNQRPRRCAACATWHAKNAAALCASLDAAEVLCGYNCLGFDIPFIEKWLVVPHARTNAWRAKTFDIFKHIVDSSGVWCKLQRMLEMNGIPGKSGTGAGAVELARRGRWDDLADYCAVDTERTYRLTALPVVKIPHARNVGYAWVKRGVWVGEWVPAEVTEAQQRGWDLGLDRGGTHGKRFRFPRDACKGGVWDANTSDSD